MEDENLRSQTDQHTENEKKEGEIFDVMRNENADLLDNFFTFKNVLIAALVLGTIIVICSGIGVL